MQLRTTNRDLKIEFGAIHILIITDVSRQFETVLAFSVLIIHILFLENT